MLRNRKTARSTQPQEQTTAPLFIQAVYPAPYRTAILSLLAQSHPIFVAFERTSDREREEEWFEKEFKFKAVDLSAPAGREIYRKELRALTKYACVIAYDYASISSLALLTWCLLRGVPYMINCDGALPRPKRWRDYLKRFFISRAAVCLAGSQSAAEYFLTFGAATSRIRRHNFTSLAEGDIHLAPATASERAHLRTELDLPHDCVTFISIGNFIHRKGFDTLLAAWTGMPSNSHLLIIGSGDQEPQYRNYIAAHAMTNVTVIQFQDTTALRRYYRAADVMVLATREDIWGLVINEAMAHGLPVITTDRCVAGVELLPRENATLLVPANDPSKLRASMLTLLAMTPEERNALGGRNLDTIRHSTYEAVTSSHLDSIASIVFGKEW